MSKKAAFTGNLSFISLSDVFQILGGNNCTGCLRISTTYSPHPGFIYLKDGNPVRSVCGSIQGLASLYAMFGWSTGEFAFYDEEINFSNSIGRSRMEIILDALRMLDDGLIQKLGPSTLTTGNDAQNRNDKDNPRIIKGPFLDYSYVIKEELYNSGDMIVKEKAHGKWLWVVYEGVVRIEKETPQGTITLTRLGEGSFIGTFKALLFGEYARSATVSAENDVRLCLLDAEMLHREYASLSYIFRTLLLSLDDRLRKTTEKAIGLPAVGEKLIRLPKRIKTIIDKGSSIDDLYKIEEGEAYIVNKVGINTVPLFTLQKNDIFGFIPFLDIGHEPNTVSVVGNGDLRLQSLDPGHMQREYDRLTPTFRNLIHHLGTCINTTTDLLFHDERFII